MVPLGSCIPSVSIGMVWFKFISLEHVPVLLGSFLPPTTGILWLIFMPSATIIIVVSSCISASCHAVALQIALECWLGSQCHVGECVPPFLWEGQHWEWPLKQQIICYLPKVWLWSYSWLALVLEVCHDQQLIVIPPNIIHHCPTQLGKVYFIHFVSDIRHAQKLVQNLLHSLGMTAIGTKLYVQKQKICC